MNRLAYLALLALPLAACATTPAPPIAAPATPPPPAPAMTQAQAHDALFALFKASDEASLRLNPLDALFRGDMRYADRFGDLISDEYFAATRAAAEQDLAAIRAIDRALLSPTDQIAYDTFAFSTAEALERLDPALLALTVVRPINHFSGFQTFYPTLSSGKGAAPFASLADYDNALKRHAGYVRFLDAAIGRFREGRAAGVVDTKLTITNVIDQLETQLRQKPEESAFYGPVRQFPASVGAADRARLKREYRAMISDQIYPAYRRLRDYLKTDYLPAARSDVGLWSMKGGDVVYRTLIEANTTLPLNAEEVHQLGLGEVARITAEMEKVRAEVGFKGDLAAFFEYLRTDKAFQPKSREALAERYYAIGRTVDAKLPAYFSTMPKTRLEIRPYDVTIEKYQAGGSYEQGTPDGKRPGVFYFNAYDLPSRTTPGITTLYLHEGSPGHHFQISLAQENEALPSFLRFGGNTAYVEGWALYAETLGYSMGLYDDPYQRFGTLSDEMLRAMRLVVDTGIHAKRWTRDQAIAYMLEHSNMGKTDATAEVERYIAIPGQALAYKVGALTIQRLRAKAEKELGTGFDLKQFHAQVLMTGALPLPVLEAKIDRWIAESKGAPSAGLRS
jgi:uncharacterized protein (DUF885 family)